MEKIKALLESCGLSPEVSQRVCDAIGEYRDTIKESLEADYATKIDRAKQLCLEETMAHKAELARRVQIYLEAKNNLIESTIRRQMAVRDTEAVAALGRVQNVLSGVDSNLTEKGLREEVAKLRTKAAKVITERDQAKATAQRLSAIADRAIKRNKVLEETRNRPQRPITESQRRPVAKLDQLRSGGKPITTRRTAIENQGPTRAIAHQSGQPQAIEPTNIAASMDEVL